MSNQKLLQLHPMDNVSIALDQLITGQNIDGINIANLIPIGHKVAIKDIIVGQYIFKYNHPIAIATQAIKAGEHVHLHNCEFSEKMIKCNSDKTIKKSEKITGSQKFFFGFKRANGKVGTRNYIAIIPSVNCSATVSKAIADHFSPRFNPTVLKNFPNVDGVVALTHQGGCATDENGLGLKLLRRVLSGYAAHPNFSAILFVGLGCETNIIGPWTMQNNSNGGPLISTLNIQSVGGTNAAIDLGVRTVNTMLIEANNQYREECDIEAIKLGLQCGGSDSFSGITANPALGNAVDLLVGAGGCAILSETPEIYGAENLLAARAINKDVSLKLLEKIRWWQDYATHNGASLDNNPSYGNKMGGLTTIVEKSLGAVSKGGSAPLNSVYEYAETITERGLVFMDTPGYDPVSATGQVAGGANLICFTTGRGSAYGSIPTPVIKISSNSLLWSRQREDLDLNCGDILEGTSDLISKGEYIFNEIVSVASGKKTKSELNGYGHQEFLPWQIGAIF